MRFTPGQIVVYPQHGPARVTGTKTRRLKGILTKYLRLEAIEGNLSLAVPVARADELGIRRLMDAAQARELFEVLAGPTGHQSPVWSRRFKANADALSQGDVLVTAEVVRDLGRRLAEKGLSFGEKRMWTQARDLLIAELQMCLGLSYDEVDSLLDTAVQDRIVPARARRLALAG